MPEQDALKQGLQQEPVQDAPQQEGKKKSNVFLILLAILLVLILTGLIIYIFYTFNKDTKRSKLSDSTNVTTSTLLDETEDTDNKEANDLYEGWLTYDGRVKLMYPENWTISADEDNPLYFKISVTSPEGYSFETWAAEGDYGVFCIYNDTDTTNMPVAYNNGTVSKIEYSSYEEFELEAENYRYAPTGDDEHTYSICRYDDSSDFYRDYFENSFFNFILPYEEVDTEEIEILKEILSSVIELN